MRMLGTVVGLMMSMGCLSAAGVDADWMWFDEGNPQESAPAGKVWFRKEVRTFEPSTCAVRMAVDDAFTLWVNGKRIGEGATDQSKSFNLNGIVAEGVNVFCIEANNAGGSAGVLLDGMIRGQGGSETPLDSGSGWLATRTPPSSPGWLAAGYVADGWKPAKSLGKHADSRWNKIVFGDTYRDRFWLGEGLELERVAEPDLAGSVIAMTWGNRGRLVVSREQGPIVSLIDSNDDGIFDQSVVFSDQMKSCQGLLVVGTDTYAVGDGPDGTGLYRLADADQDDKAEAIEKLHRHRGGMGEHGPHALVLGPDGQLYHCVGNHAGIRAKRQPNSPNINEIEGYLLTPKFEDGRGHAAGIKAPGGTVWRFSPDGKKWWLETGGFRNEYDIAFNADGELFTFDSDMEWDIGIPWYRPVRVNHCISGAEFGWRSGAAKWPAGYFDSLPSTVDIGRGSPTGVVFYEHNQLPGKYRGSLLICDWSMGRILAVMLDPKGASFDGSRTETIVTGNPLNVSDIEVARDGSILFSTGGRGTEGGIYRVRALGATPVKASAGSVAELMSLPQMSAGWARELAADVKKVAGDTWEKELGRFAASGTPAEKVRALTLMGQLGPAPSVDQLSAGIRDADPSVRAFATWLFGFQAKEDSSSLLGSLLTDLDPRVQRRACAAFVHAGLEAPVEPLLNLLGSEDRFLAFSARLALERVPVDKWKESILASADDRVVVQGLLALSRLKPAMISGTETMDRLVVLLRKGTKEMPAVLRMAQLAALAGASGPSADEFGKMLLAKYPTGDVLIDREMSRLIAKLQVPGSAEVFVQRLDKEPSREEQVHLALVLRYLDVGWSTDLKSRYIRWYDRSQSLDGGHSFVPYLENIVSATFPRLTPDERHDLLTAWKEHPYAARLLLRRNNPDQVTDFPALAEMLLAESDKGGVAFAGEIYDLCVDALSRSENPTCHAILRRLFDENPDRRDMLAAKIAEHPTPESRPYFIRSLVFASDTTLQFVLRALFRLGGKAESPEEIRQAIIAGLKLNENGGKIAVDLLEKWTEQKPPGSEILPNLAFYQEWFAKTYPNEPAPDLPKVDKTQVKFTVDEIMNYLETNPRGRSGDAVRGKEMYAKALCIKCHKFGQEGNGIGPDLTTLRRRFQKKEIVEAIVYPSQVVSDQYRTVTVVTADGLVQTGMLAPQQGQERVVLWLNNGDRMEIAKDDIEEQKPSSVSLMPPGLIKDLTLEDISDLFAYLETSKSNTEPGSSGSPSADTTGQGGK